MEAAIDSGNLAGIRRLLAATPTADRGKWLEHAVWKRNIDIIAVFLEAGVSVNFVDADGTSAFIWAAVYNDENLATFLLSKGADVNIKTTRASGGDKTGITALHVTARHGYADFAALLLANGAVIDSPDIAGDTPLIYSVRFSRPALFKLLLEAGADPYFKNNGGKSAFDLAAGRTEMLDILMSSVYVKTPPTGKESKPEETKVEKLAKTTFAGKVTKTDAKAPLVVKDTKLEEIKVEKLAKTPHAGKDTKTEETKVEKLAKTPLAGKETKPGTKVEKIVEAEKPKIISSLDAPISVPVSVESKTFKVVFKSEVIGRIKVVDWKSKSLKTVRDVLPEHIDDEYLKILGADWLFVIDGAPISRKQEPAEMLHEMKDESLVVKKVNESKEGSLEFSPSSSSERKDSLSPSKDKSSSAKSEVLEKLGSDLEQWKSQAFSIPRIKDDEIKDEEYLAKGSFKDVYKGTWKDKQVAVIRIGKVAEKMRKAIEKEVRVLSFLSGRTNIIGLLGVTEPSFRLVTELCTSNLGERIIYDDPPVPFLTRLNWLLDVCRGLKVMHGLNFAHGDIKPENVLIDEQNLAKITDFGSTEKIIRETSSGSTVGAMSLGTHRFMGPEMYVLASERKDFTRDQGDVFSMGCLIIFVLCGKAPWSEETEEVIKDHLRASWKSKESFLPILELDLVEQFCREEGCSEENVALIVKTIKNCLSTVPSDRMRISALYDCLSTLVEAARTDTKNSSVDKQLRDLREWMEVIADRVLRIQGGVIDLKRK